MNPQRISVCIPAYKAERYLGETLETVREQEFTDWELIVVEDGSRDRTEEIVRGFGARVSQSVRYLRHETNRGLTVTRNTGIAQARAEWVAILDSDDLWTPDHLTKCVDRADAGDVDVVHGWTMLFDSESGRELELRAPDARAVADFPCSLFDNRYVIQPSSVIISKSLWNGVGGFNPNFQHVEDREMWLRCARAGARFASTGQETCRYRKHGTAMSSQSAEMAEASARVLDQHLDWAVVPIEVRRRITAEAWAAAARLRWRGEPTVARAHFRRANAIEWRLRWWLHGALCALLPGRAATKT